MAPHGLRGVQDGPGLRGRDPGRESRGIESRGAHGIPKSRAQTLILKIGNVKVSKIEFLGSEYLNLKANFDLWIKIRNFKVS